MKNSTLLYSDPSVIIISNFNDTSADGIINFSTENNLEFNIFGVTMDMNKFLLTDNLYENNFSGMNSGIVYLHNIRRVNMVGETFNKNSGHYQEALETYGTIDPKTNDDIVSRGAIPFSEYYNNKSESYIANISGNEGLLQYPGSPIVFDGVVDILLNNLTFDNNFKQENGVLDFGQQVEQSQCITVRRSKGRFKVSGLIVKNQNGIEIDLLVGCTLQSLSNT